MRNRARAPHLIALLFLVTVMAYATSATLPAQDSGSPQAPAESEAGGPSRSFTFNLWERIKSGGPLMFPIGLCSVVLLALGLERLVSTRRSRVAPFGFVEDVEEAYREEGIGAARELCSAESHSLSRVVLAGLKHPKDSREELKEVVESAARREIYSLRRNLRALSVTAAIAPLLGLLGTVGGMIDVFDKYTAVLGADDKVRVFSSGISTALVTTFAGLSVAIPATVIYQFFLARIGRFGDEVQRAFVQIFEPMLHARNEFPATPQQIEERA